MTKRRTSSHEHEPARTFVCALGITHKPGAGIHKSQRDSVTKPRVGALRLPWERGPTEVSTPTGLRLSRSASSHNPFGVEILSTAISQGSSCLATLGSIAESRWDSATNKRERKR